MRLSRLAKNIEQKPNLVQKFLEEKFGADVDFGLNNKLEEVHIDAVIAYFGIPTKQEEVNIPNDLDTNEAHEETLFSQENGNLDAKEKEEIEVEIFEIPSEEKTPVVDSKEAINTSNSVLDEEKTFEMREGNVVNELGSKLENGVIRAPKAEKLKGITVVSKIDIPEPKTLSEEKESEEAVITNATLRKEQASLRKKKRAEAKEKAQQNKLKRELKALEQQKKKVEKAEKKRKEEKLKAEKVRKRKYYEEKMAKNSSHSESKRNGAKKKNNSKSKSSINKKVRKPEPTTLWGKFWKWFNAE